MLVCRVFLRSFFESMDLNVFSEPFKRPIRGVQSGTNQRPVLISASAATRLTHTSDKMFNLGVICASVNRAASGSCIETNQHTSTEVQYSIRVHIKRGKSRL